MSRTVETNEFNYMARIPFRISWNYQVIVSYWQEIHKHINNVFGVNIPRRRDTLYMGEISFEGWNISDKKPVQVLMAGGEKSEPSATGE